LTAYINQPQKSKEVKGLLKWLKNNSYKNIIRKKTISPTVMKTRQNFFKNTDLQKFTDLCIALA